MHKLFGAWYSSVIIYNILQPANITNMFGNCLNGLEKNDKARIYTGVSVFCWSIWTSRNDITLNKHNGTNFLQVIRRTPHLIQTWAYLLLVDQ
jgi:hypothetical protein